MWAVLAPSSTSGGASAPLGGCMLGSGLGRGPIVINEEGIISGHGWAAPARCEGVGAEGRRVVNCLAANTFKLFVAGSGDPDLKVFREEFEVADGLYPAEEFV